MTRKIRVGIIFGGKSAEHEVSLQSAKNVIDAIDKEKFEPVLIGVTKDGKWLQSDSSEFLLNTTDPKLIKLNSDSTHPVALIPESSGQIAHLESSGIHNSIDVVFPILHGPFGEDGTIQGLLKLAHIPFVGSGVLGSAVGMDKDVMKRLLRDAGIPIGKFISVKQNKIPPYADVVKRLGIPLFIKPANMGSSVGVSKVKNEKEFDMAIQNAFLFDKKVIIEEFIDGREIECAVLGNEDPKASIPGEILPNTEFYSYESKYIDENGAAIEIPAKLSAEKTKELQQMAIKTFQVLECEGLSRVDFFVTKDDHIFVNEINTIPGFTSISMYPKLWEESGIGYTELITKLIELAIERFEVEKSIQTSYKLE